MTTAGRALRLAVGGTLVWWLVAAVSAPEYTTFSAAAAALILAATAWQPRSGLALMIVLAPAATLMTAPPARAAELLAWSLVAGWLVSVWRPLAHSGWPRNVMLPAVLYAGALGASWLGLIVGGAAGVPPASLPQFILHAIPRDHLIMSSPEAETWTLLQSLAGLAVFIAAVGIARTDVRTPRSLALAIAGSMSVLAAATSADVIRQWAEAGYGADFLWRYLRAERFSFPVSDVNAAGSLYALAAVIAIGCAWLQPVRRGVWMLVLAILAPAIWLSGSRSAYLAIVSGAAVLGGIRQRWQPTKRHVVAAAAVFLVSIVAAGFLVDPQSQAQGSAGQSASLRSQFLLTSGRMLGSAPVFGVGVGRYFERSAEFLTPELRTLYGNENAHNYFAQQFAELGIVGGALFVWFIVAVLSRGWRAVLGERQGSPLQALFAGTVAYVLTCATGHPLLVPEAALPFWAAFGTVAGAAATASAALTGTGRALGIAAGVMLAAGVGQAALVYTRTTDVPMEHGFHQFETTTDGTRFRWMTRHAVTYVPEGPGFLQIKVRAPGWPAPRSVILETSIAGQVVDRRNVPPDTSTIFDVPARIAARERFRRVDFRVNQEWFEEVSLGQRRARRPVSVMVEYISWMPL